MLYQHATQLVIQAAETTDTKLFGIFIAGAVICMIFGCLISVTFDNLGKK